MRCDTRNLLNLPRGRAAAFTGSHTLDLAVAARSLIAVDAASIFEYAFPCCRRGGACCPFSQPGCCSHWRVGEWLARTARAGVEDTRDYTRTVPARP